MRCVDDNLLLAKEDHIQYIFDKFNSFHEFTMWKMYNDNNVNFFDITMDKADTDLYYKITHTGQYSHCNCSLAWNCKFS